MALPCLALPVSQGFTQASKLQAPWEPLGLRLWRSDCKAGAGEFKATLKAMSVLIAGSGACRGLRSRKPRRQSWSPVKDPRRCGALCLSAAQDTHEKSHEDTEDLYVRVLCTSIQWVGEHGAIVGLRQFNDMDAPHHSVELPLDFPILLSAFETDAWQRAMEGVPSFLKEFNQPLDSLAICEVRVHLEPGDRQGEVIIAEAYSVPASDRDDGLIRLEQHPVVDTSPKEHRAAVSLGEALSIAQRFSLPLLLEARALLAAAKACVDCMRLEQLVCSDDAESCDLELLFLSERLAEALKPGAPASVMGLVMKQLKPFAWYWAEQGPALAGAALDKAVERKPLTTTSNHTGDYPSELHNPEVKAMIMVFEFSSRIGMA
eukprot:CAMPEP_0197630890 /NCGR_PEP_ID=MMETSP1338-20131121/8241_1 /TAXON_ID=43686 ORGANISM="Pelagodinium beii, Strain RCC1491" /NCGR_SAMPLE_ID=MMETSP1338 /ASSEMBLY_ACC=CAM_ASM_000754 /LENGTH=374 /DNA_ID=CAMNT_0043202227 /DNA_START=16 /DNA_END=1138 /DNA_ORIENTATION=+